MCGIACSCLKGILATVFAIINIGFLLCGIAALILAVLAKVKLYNVVPDQIVGVLGSTPIVLAVIGAVICVVAFLGCCGFNRRSMICLIPYAACIAVVFIAGLVVCIMMGVYSNRFKESMEKTMREKFDTYRTSFDDKRFWNDMQKDAWCCGLEGPEDWKNNLPESCCTGKNSEYTKESNVCSNKSSNKTPYVYKNGCLKGVEEFIKKYWNIIMYMNLVLTLFSIVAFALALFIICDFKG